MTDNGPLGFGLIGCGAFGLFCMDAYSKLDAIRPIAVCDVREDVARDFARDLGLEAHGDPDALIARNDIDIVHIATPPSTHHELVLSAARARKHVLCEKPLAMTVAEADEMLAAARRVDRIAPVNFVLRHNEISRRVKDLLDSRVLGNVLRANLTNCAADSNLHQEHWFWNRELSGGIFVEHGVHFFDLYREWLGEGQVISSHTEMRPGTAQEDRVMCIVRHDSGAVVAHYHGFDQVGPMDRTNHRLVCEMGDIWVDGWIPLSIGIDAAVDDRGHETLENLLPGVELEIVEEFDVERQQVQGRGRHHHVTKRIRLHYCPEPDKQTIYANSVLDLMADQVAYVRDRSHARIVTESNGRDALALAEAAKMQAEKG
ncbi:MAG: Gfo/Idh/MocA family oxidoreductase [Planctomycetes bacterium]|jgi:predicted dehydrogenase|nr:Gfo/Idh/MocA family oxidoreductase [Planctomycetota bacterium]